MIYIIWILLALLGSIAWFVIGSDFVAILLIFINSFFLIIKLRWTKEKQ